MIAVSVLFINDQGLFQCDKDRREPWRYLSQFIGEELWTSTSELWKYNPKTMLEFIDDYNKVRVVIIQMCI